MPASGTTGTGSTAPLKIIASFYPLQHIVEQAGGNLVKVESLTPPGTEPHNLELSPASVARCQDPAAAQGLPHPPPALSASA